MLTIPVVDIERQKQCTLLVAVLVLKSGEFWLLFAHWQVSLISKTSGTSTKFLICMFSLFDPQRPFRFDQIAEHIHFSH